MNGQYPEPLPGPSLGPMPRRDARRAAREQRLVWIKYRQPNGQVTEGQVEIYHVTWRGEIRGWCRTRRCRCTFKRERILAWQLLGERFERAHNMERWARWSSWLDRFRQRRDERRRQQLLGR